jgi:hypothetical protein
MLALPQETQMPFVDFAELKTGVSIDGREIASTVERYCHRGLYHRGCALR